MQVTSRHRARPRVHSQPPAAQTLVGEFLLHRMTEQIGPPVLIDFIQNIDEWIFLSEKVSTEAQKRWPGTGLRPQKVKNAAVAVSCFFFKNKRLDNHRGRCSWLAKHRGRSGKPPGWSWTRRQCDQVERNRCATESGTRHKWQLWEPNKKKRCRDLLTCDELLSGWRNFTSRCSDKLFEPDHGKKEKRFDPGVGNHVHKLKDGERVSDRNPESTVNHVKAQITTKSMCEKMNVEADLKVKRPETF